MKHGIIVILLSVLLAACQSDLILETTPVAAQTESAAITMQYADISLGLEPPSDWRAFVQAENRHIMLTQVSSIENPSSIIMNIWLPDIELSESADITAVLAQIVQEMRQYHNVVISEPISIEWNGHPASYYVMPGNNNRFTVVAAIHLPDDMGMLAININDIPHENMADLREMLADVLANLTVNGHHVGGGGLLHLPDTLEASPTNIP